MGGPGEDLTGGVVVFVVVVVVVVVVQMMWVVRMRTSQVL